MDSELEVLKTRLLVRPFGRRKTPLNIAFNGAKKKLYLCIQNLWRGPGPRLNPHSKSSSEWMIKMGISLEVSTSLVTLLWRIFSQKER